MSNDKHPQGLQTSPPGDGELLSAYLAGELEPAIAQALEHRLTHDPALLARLEDTHEMLTRLRRLEDVEPPEGLAARVRERIAVERAADAPAGRPDAATADTVAPHGSGNRSVSGADATVTPLRRWLRSPRLQPVAAAVAVLAVVALTATSLLINGAGDESVEDMAAGTRDAAGGEAQIESLAEAPADGGAQQESAAQLAPQAAEPDDAQPDGGADTAASPDATTRAATESGPVLSPPPGDTVPVARDTQVELEDAQHARDYFTDVPQVTALLGVGSADTTGRAQRYEDRLQRAARSLAEAPAQTCLTAATESAGASAVPVRMETVVYDGEPGLAFVFVAAGSDRFDTVLVRVLDTSCSTMLALDHSP